jgi:saccharopine dehydrogenase (NAD+, L-lysine forming)
MKIGIIREGKNPPDSRVALTPRQCHYINELYPVEIVVEPSPNRSYSDAEYQQEGVRLCKDLSDCDVLIGVKEVPITQLIPNKTYFFFSHTIKKQSYNQKLLQAVIRKKIRLMDYETIKNHRGERLIAFGHYAGMVGAHNALWTLAQRSQTFELPRMYQSHDYFAVKKIYRKTTFPAIKIVLTGNGRVAQGALEVLRDMKIKQVVPSDFLTRTYNEAVFTQLQCEHYVTRKDGATFVKSAFYKNPSEHKSSFAPYTNVADVFINGIYWDPSGPAFFELDEMAKPDFKIKVIADVTCDIAPASSVPSTLRPSTIPDPVYGFDPQTQQETAPYQANGIDIMAIDNLPNELPRDASEFFGKQFIEKVLPELLHYDNSSILERATIADNGDLTEGYEYLREYCFSPS